jgi:hypothetical protein
MENQFPKLKALMEEKRAVRERKEQQAKGTASGQQPKAPAQVVDRDTLRDWVATQAARMKPVLSSPDLKGNHWGFEFEEWE